MIANLGASCVSGSGENGADVRERGVPVIELCWNNPISQERMSRYLRAIPLRPEQRVIDIGCGCGEVLIRVAEQSGAAGLGIDQSPEFIAEARRRESKRVDPARVEFVVADAGHFPIEAGHFHLALCLGASHAFGLGSSAYQQALRRMIPMVASGGSLLIGEGYLKQPATPVYREFLGDAIPEGMTHAANVTAGRDLGLVPLAAWTSSVEEWDDFEWAHQRIAEWQSRDNPDDPVKSSKLEWRRRWIDAYLRWGRDTLGFGIYLFEKR